LNGRRQILLQDDIAGATADVQWRMHTNATVATSGTTATLTLGGETLIASILSGPDGAVFSTALPVPGPDSPPIPTGSQYDENLPNNEAGVYNTTVLVVDVPAGGSFSLQVLFNPQWSGLSSSDYVTPPNVALNSWTLTSHNW
jgi:hypothetical protein